MGFGLWIITAVIWPLNGYAASNLDFSTIETQQQAFLKDDAFLDNHKRLTQLEQQALQLAQDEPLKLGALGTAILDIYPASLTGHYCMWTFYSHLSESTAASAHWQEIEKIRGMMSAQGDATALQPQPILTIYEANTIAALNQQSPVGAIYQNNDRSPLGYLLAARTSEGKIEYSYFSLTQYLDRFNSEHGTDPANVWRIIRDAATNMDNAAQAAIGAYMARHKQYKNAKGWLGVAARSGNTLANNILASVYHTQSLTEEDPETLKKLKDQSLEHHMQAIAMGSTQSMYTLANLYLNDYFGEDNRTAAFPLLQQAGDLGHVESLIYLGHLHGTGQHAEKDLEKAERYFAQAAVDQDPDAVLNYARFVFANRKAPESPTLVNWLTDLAKKDNAQAMVSLANLYARGVGTKTSTRQAVKWYKRAVKQDPLDADIVNEVAWTLTVSDVKKLTRKKYAHKVMEHMMSNHKEKGSQLAQRPEYLDTWAATYAANGNFEQALALQQQAIAIATEEKRNDVLEILELHLKQFSNGEPITEPAP